MNIIAPIFDHFITIDNEKNENTDDSGNIWDHFTHAHTWEADEAYGFYAGLIVLSGMLCTFKALYYSPWDTSHRGFSFAIFSCYLLTLPGALQYIIGNHSFSYTEEDSSNILIGATFLSIALGILLRQAFPVKHKGDDVAASAPPFDSATSARATTIFTSAANPPTSGPDTSLDSSATTHTTASQNPMDAALPTNRTPILPSASASAHNTSSDSSATTHTTASRSSMDAVLPTNTTPILPSASASDHNTSSDSSATTHTTTSRSSMDADLPTNTTPILPSASASAHNTSSDSSATTHTTASRSSMDADPQGASPDLSVGSGTTNSSSQASTPTSTPPLSNTTASRGRVRQRVFSFSFTIPTLSSQRSGSQPATPRDGAEAASAPPLPPTSSTATGTSFNLFRRTHRPPTPGDDRDGADDPLIPPPEPTSARGMNRFWSRGSSSNSVSRNASPSPRASFENEPRPTAQQEPENPRQPFQNTRNNINQGLDQIRATMNSPAAHAAVRSVGEAAARATVTVLTAAVGLPPPL